MSATKVIISLTSHTKERMQNLSYFLYHSIFKYNYDYVKVVLTLAKPDVKNITSDLQTLIDNELVELIIAEHDLKCNLKYFYAMKKYRDLPIITIDDDSIYPEKMIPDLLDAYKLFPNVVIGRSAVVIPSLQKYKTYLECACVNTGLEKVLKWSNFCDKILPNLNLEGYGGILYPPDILKIHDGLIQKISLFTRADDIYLYLRERELGVKMIVPRYAYNKLEKSTKGFDSISLKTDNIRMIDSLIRKFAK